MRSAFALTPQRLLVQEYDGQRKLVVPTSMRQKVMASCHDEPTKGHTGIYRTTELVKQRYWWKGMVKDIENYVKSCPVCQVMKSDHRKKVGRRLTDSNSHQEMRTDHNGSGDRLTAICWIYSHRCLCGSSYQDGSLCPMYQGDQC